MTDIVALCMNPSIDISTSVEGVVPIRKLRCATLQRDPGGGGINVARVVRRFGADVSVIYPTGGCTGQLLRRLVDREGLQSSAIQLSEETREDFTVLETASGTQFRFILPKPRLSAQEWRACLDAVASVQGRSRVLVASGSLPPGVPEDFYGQVARNAKEMGVKVALDTSGPPLQAALNEGVYLVKPNLRELAGLLQRRLEDQDAWVEASCELGRAEVVALTLGDQGALLVTREQAWRAKASPIKPVSAVGAGDSFLGAMVWSLASGHNLEDAFRYANAAGSAAVLAPGTELCRGEDVENLYSQVAIQAIS